MTPVRKKAINPKIMDNLVSGADLKDVSRPPQPLRSDEIAALLSASAYNARPKALAARNQAMIVVWWRAGLRLGESLALRPSDVDVKAGTIYVRDGKGEVSRTVGIDGPSAIIIQRWIDVRTNDLKLPKNRGPLFCSQTGAPLTSQAAQIMLKRAGRRADLGDTRVYPHALRHAMAAELARERVPIAYIQRQLGHARLDTTAEYLKTIAPQETIDAMHSRSWTPEALAALSQDG